MKYLKNKNNRRGTTAVEFSLVLPLLLTIVFGLLEWGRFEMCRQASSTAAFNAARLGAIPGSSSADAEARAAAILDNYFINGASVTANLTSDGWGHGISQCSNGSEQLGTDAIFRECNDRTRIHFELALSLRHTLVWRR